MFFTKIIQKWSCLLTATWKQSLQLLSINSKRNIKSVIRSWFVNVSKHIAVLRNTRYIALIDVGHLFLFPVSSVASLQFGGFRYLQRIHAGRKDKEDRCGGACFLERLGEFDGSTLDVPWAKLLLDKCCDCIGHSVGAQRSEHAQTLNSRLVLPFLWEFLPLRALAFHQLFPSLRRALYVSI